MARGTCCCGVCLLFFALLCVGCRLMGPGLIHQQIREGVKDRVIVRPSMPADIYGTFLNNTSPDASPSHMSFYFFNITNLDDVRGLGAKPVLEELGPYTYRQYNVKYDVDFSFSGEVTYKDFKYFIEVPELTKGSFDDKITTLNMPLVGALTKIEKEYQSTLGWILGMIAAQISKWSDGEAIGLFAKRSVNDLLWGYQDPLLKQLKRFVDINDYVSFFTNYTQAGDDRLNIMNTGLRDLSLVGQLELFEDLAEYEWAHHMEQVHGTDGTRFNPKSIEVGASLDIWVGELYRSLKVSSKEQVDFSGVDVVRFEIDESVLEPNIYYDQQLYGMINITTPMKSAEGAPVFMSLPHYCRTSEEVREGVIGLKCDEKRHTLYVDVEPHTGFTLRGARRLMMSSEYGPQFSSIEPNIPHTFLPIFWIDGEEQANDEQLSLLKDSIYWALDVLKVIKIMTLVISITFGVIGFGFILCDIRLLIRKRALKKRHSAKIMNDFHDSAHSAEDAMIDLAPKKREISAEGLGSPLFDGKNSPDYERNMDSAWSWHMEDPEPIETMHISPRGENRSPLVPERV